VSIGDPFFVLLILALVGTLPTRAYSYSLTGRVGLLLTGRI
jgi:hypothetical protein